MSGDRSSVMARFRIWVGAKPKSTIVSSLVLVYVLASSLTWAFITPPGGAPDEPSHIAYAAAEVRGEVGTFQAINQPNYPGLMVVTVPAWVGSFTDPPRSVEAFEFPCFRFKPETTANCAPILSNSTTPTEVPTTVTRYPPPYYWIVGLPTLALSGDNAVYAMRATAALLATGLIGLGLAAASPQRRQWLALGVAVAVTPMAAHLFGSVNPSGMEIAAALGLGIALIGASGDDARNPWPRNAVIAFLAVALAWSRPRSFLTLGAVVVAAVLLNQRELRVWLKNRTNALMAGSGVGLAAVSAMVFDTSFRGVPATGPIVGKITGDLASTGVSVSETLREVERRFVDNGLDLIGRLGWVDHTPPESVRLGWAALIVALVILALVLGSRRDRLGLVTVSFGALAIAPAYIILRVLRNPDIYQARYVLPLAVLIVLGSVRIISDEAGPRGRDRAWSILRWSTLLLPMGMLVALAGSFHRYSIGGIAQLSDLWDLVGGFHEWVPPTGVLVGAMLGVLIVLGSAVALFAMSRQQAVAPPTASVSALPEGPPDSSLGL